MDMRLGTAHWADPAQVDQKDRYRYGKIWLGRSATPNHTPLGYIDDRHICLVCGSRGGKGASSIITNLCLWPGSVLVVDPKGENATVTAARRGKGSDVCEGLGQAVHVLDPFNEAKVDGCYRSKFNPLDALKTAGKETVNAASLIANALVVLHEDAKEPFWEETARNMVWGLVMHVATAPEFEGRRNLLTVRQLITSGDWMAVERLKALGANEIAPAQFMLWKSLAENPALNGAVADVGNSILEMWKEDAKLFRGSLQEANTNTSFIIDPDMQECLGASDFDLRDLKKSEEGVSIYLCLPQRHMDTHYRWLRMMISLVYSEMEKLKEEPASGYDVLFLLDEFAGLRRMETIEHAAAQMAGAHVKMFFVLQSLVQLKAVYKDSWENFLSNCSIKLFSSVDDQFTREHISKLIGDTEIIREVHSEGDSSSESESQSESESDSESESLSESESESASSSRSESSGDSLSYGHTETEGTNRSSSRSRSHGVNESRSFTSGHSYTRGRSSTWTPNGISLTTSDSGTGSTSTTNSEGTSDSWSESDTEGSSRGSSDSVTAGRSRTSGTSASETSGRTRGATHGSTRGATRGTTEGTTHGRTTGKSETVHRRRLISPEEIGRLFARIDDRNHSAYPGLGLALIAGQDPVAFRRVNYFEDIQFIGYFQPHPQHEFRPPRKHVISTKDWEPYKKYIPDLNWSLFLLPGAIVHEGEVIGCMNSKAFKDLVPIRAPCSGRIVAVPEKVNMGKPEGAARFLEYFKAGSKPAEAIPEKLPEATLPENFAALAGLGSSTNETGLLAGLPAFKDAPNLLSSFNLTFELGDVEILSYDEAASPADAFEVVAARCREIELERRRAIEAEERRSREQQRFKEEEERRKREEAAREAERKAAVEKAARDARYAAALRQWEEDKRRVRQKRDMWILAAIAAGVALLVDIGVTLFTQSPTGIAVGLGVAALIAICGARIRQRVIEERAIKKPSALLFFGILGPLGPALLTNEQMTKRLMEFLEKEKKKVQP
jgi:type IV secretory pathway TraG/TraD family ATPase VirD4